MQSPVKSALGHKFVEHRRPTGSKWGGARKRMKEKYRIIRPARRFPKT